MQLYIRIIIYNRDEPLQKFYLAWYASSVGTTVERSGRILALLNRYLGSSNNHAHQPANMSMYTGTVSG